MGNVRKIKDFHKYQHIIRLGEPEVEGILNGTVYCFPKLDGSQRQIYKYNDELVIAGHDGMLEGKNKEGHEIYEHNERFINFFKKYPNLRLFGEYLIPHELRFYKEDAWRKIYIFDVAERIGEDKAGQSIWGYLTYEQYVPMLEEFGIEYIELALKLENPTLEDILDNYDKSGWLTTGYIGEGFVLKNYDFKAYNGRTLWAKAVWREYPELKKKLGESKQEYNKYLKSMSVEDKIVMDYLTNSFIAKEYYKLKGSCDLEEKIFNMRFINNTYKVLLEEEIYHIIKKYKEPVIDFNKLREKCETKINKFINN